MRILIVSLALFLSLLSGCATTNLGVGASSKLCCPAAEVQTFSVKTEAVPGFLEQLLVSNLSTVLAHKGLQPEAAGADLAVTIRYEQEDLPIAARHDDFDERVSEGGDVRFIARIAVIMQTSTGETVFEGAIQRIHDVSPGEYMHTGTASVAIFEAFEEMLAVF